MLPFALDLKAPALSDDADLALAALEKTAATIAIESLVSLAKVNDIDHLGGGLELIGPLLMTLGAVDYRGTQFSIEHGHTSIGYYAALSALGFLPRERVVESFRRSLDIAGHVLWVPGGTPIGSGRLGVTVPVTAGWSLGLKAAHGQDALVDLSQRRRRLDFRPGAQRPDRRQPAWRADGAGHAPQRHPVVGHDRARDDKDPRMIAEGLGIEVVEIASLHERRELFGAYAQAAALARNGKPSLIYPVGDPKATVRDFADALRHPHTRPSILRRSTRSRWIRRCRSRDR